jgi:hypothetical protein
MTSTDGINELGDSSYLFIQITNNIWNFAAFPMASLL